MGKYSSGSTFLGISGRAAGVGDTHLGCAHYRPHLLCSERRGMTKQQPTAPITPDRDIQELENTPQFRYCSEDHSFLKKYKFIYFNWRIILINYRVVI